MFLLYFFEKKSLAEVLITHAEEKWLCRISSFYEKRKTKQLKQNLQAANKKNVRKFPRQD